jgi:hypothetical protein
MWRAASARMCRSDDPSAASTAGTQRRSASNIDRMVDLRTRSRSVVSVCGKAKRREEGETTTLWKRRGKGGRKEEGGRSEGWHTVVEDTAMVIVAGHLVVAARRGDAAPPAGTVGTARVVGVRPVGATSHALPVVAHLQRQSRHVRQERWRAATSATSGVGWRRRRKIVEVICVTVVEPRARAASAAGT